MQSEFFTELRRRQPFQPFRVHTSDGAAYVVRQAELLLVLKTELVIGIPAPDEPKPIYEYTVDVPLASIDRVEMLTGADAGSRT